MPLSKILLMGLIAQSGVTKCLLVIVSTQKWINMMKWAISKDNAANFKWFSFHLRGERGTYKDFFFQSLNCKQKYPPCSAGMISKTTRNTALLSVFIDFKDWTLLSIGLLFRFSLKNTIFISFINLQKNHVFHNIARALFQVSLADSQLSPALICRV